MRRDLVAALVIAIALPAAAAHAADEALALRMRAEQLAAEDRCDEALPRARRARDLDSRDVRAAVVEGRCELRLGRYREALGALRSAQELDPSFPGLATDMAQCHYHVDELDSAEGQLERALSADPDDARALLYRGLLHLRRAETAEAAAALERASGDSSISPVASYYAGLAWEAARDRERASAALERARTSAPDSDWAREAERALDRVDEPYKRHFWASVTGGVQHDSNVTLRQDGTNADLINQQVFGPFDDFDPRQDLVGVFFGQVGGELLRHPDWSLGAIAGYQGSAHTDIHEFDVQYPWLSLWLDRRIDEKTFVRLQPFGGYSWLETDPFVIHGGATLSLGRQLAEGLTAQVYGRYNYNDYRFRIPDDVVLSLLPGGGVPSLAGAQLNRIARRHRNRDGSEIDTGIEVDFDLDRSKTGVRGGVAYERYESEGQDWQRQGARVWLGVSQELPLEFTVHVDGSFAHRPYAHRSSFLNPFILFKNSQPPGSGSTNPPYSGPKRIDNVWQARVELERPIHENVTLSARYQYVDNQSNTKVFDIERHVVGGYITISWDN